VQTLSQADRRPVPQVRAVPPRPFCHQRKHGRMRAWLSRRLGRPRRDAYREILSRADIWGATRASLLLTAHVDGHQRHARTPSSPTSDKAAVLTAASKTRLRAIAPG